MIGLKCSKAINAVIVPTTHLVHVSPCFFPAWSCQTAGGQIISNALSFTLMVCHTLVPNVSFYFCLGSTDESTYIVQTLDFHLGHNTMVTKPCGALESPMATITKITRRRHENPPHGVATVKEWFNYVTAMRNEGEITQHAPI